MMIIHNSIVEPYGDEMFKSKVNNAMSENLQ